MLLFSNSVATAAARQLDRLLTGDSQTLSLPSAKQIREPDLPSLPNNAFTDLKKERLALSREHLNLQDRTIKHRNI